MSYYCSTQTPEIFRERRRGTFHATLLTGTAESHALSVFGIIRRIFVIILIVTDNLMPDLVVNGLQEKAETSMSSYRPPRNVHHTTKADCEAPNIPFLLSIPYKVHFPQRLSYGHQI